MGRRGGSAARSQRRRTAPAESYRSLVPAQSARDRQIERRLQREDLGPELLWTAKRAGFSDQTIARLSRRSEPEVRCAVRRHMLPVYKMVDTCAGEFAAATPYFYSTYEEEDEALPLGRSRAVVVGSGPIRIGQGIEFDYSAVQAAQALHDNGIASIMINSNPETVSTDFDASDPTLFRAIGQ